MQNAHTSIRSLLLLVFLFLTPALCIWSQEAPLTPEETTAYNQLILNEVQKADDAATAAMQELGKTPGVSVADSTRVSILANMAQVKHTLANNLINSPSVLNSSEVRSRFLQIMKQDIIEDQDLLNLQALMDSVNAQLATPAVPAAPSETTGSTGATDTTGTTGS